MLTNLLHRGPLETTPRAACGPRVGQPWPRSSWIIWVLFQCYFATFEQKSIHIIKTLYNFSCK